MPKKKKTVYVCQDCGYDTPKWLGKCPGCGAWNTMVEEVVALELLDYLRRHYLADLQNRYQADKDASSHWRDEEWLEWIGRKRGALLPGGRINYQKAAEVALTDFRDGQIGRITLETPNQWATWLKVARQNEAALKAAREAKKAERKGGGKA